MALSICHVVISLGCCVAASLGHAVRLDTILNCVDSWLKTWPEAWGALLLLFVLAGEVGACGKHLNGYQVGLAGGGLRQ